MSQEAGALDGAMLISLHEIYRLRRICQWARPSHPLITDLSWGRKYSGVMLLMTAAIVLANLKIIRTAAPVYDVVWDYLAPIAIPLLLFRADLKRVDRKYNPGILPSRQVSTGR